MSRTYPLFGFLARGSLVVSESAQHRADLAARAYQSLHSEFVAAIHANPSTVIQTPGYGPGKAYSVAMVVADELGGSDEGLHELLRIVVDAASGQDVQLRASAWIAQRAAGHATFHTGDAVDRLESDGDKA